MERGFIVLWRKMLEWGWIGDPPVLCLFVHLLLKANHKDSMFRGREIRRGEAVVGLHALSKQTGLSVRQIRTALTKLESTGEIRRFATNEYTVITILNYSEYQDVKERERQTSDKRATNERQRLNHDNHENNIKDPVRKRVSYGEDFSVFWKKYPRGENKKKAYDIWKRKKISNGLFKEVMAGLDNYLESDQWKRGIIPHATTWLNGEQWNDEIKEPKQSQDQYGRQQQVDYL